MPSSNCAPTSRNVNFNNFYHYRFTGSDQTSPDQNTQVDVLPVLRSLLRLDLTGDGFFPNTKTVANVMVINTNIYLKNVLRRRQYFVLLAVRMVTQV